MAFFSLKKAAAPTISIPRGSSIYPRRFAVLRRMKHSLSSRGCSVFRCGRLTTAVSYGFRSLTVKRRSDGSFDDCDGPPGGDSAVATVVVPYADDPVQGANDERRYARCIPSVHTAAVASISVLFSYDMYNA